MRCDLHSNSLGDQLCTVSEAVLESRFMVQGYVMGFGDPDTIAGVVHA